MKKNFPSLKSKNSNIGRKIIKSLPQYQSYILQALQNHWCLFEKKAKKIKNQQELQTLLTDIFKMLNTTCPSLASSTITNNYTDNLYKSKPSNPIRNRAQKKKNIQKQKKIETTLSETVSKENEHTITNIFTNKTFKSESFASILNQSDLHSNIEPDKTNTENINEPKKKISTEWVKYFKDIDLITVEQKCEDSRAEKLIAVASNQECYINFDKIWNGKSRWFDVKHNLIHQGVLKSNGLYISLPINSHQFYIGCGNFGSVEFAFTKNFHAIALKRLTENGRISVFRCDGIRKKIYEMDGQLMTPNYHNNLLKMNIFYDMCGYTWLYTMLAEYNLAEYLASLRSANEGTEQVRLSDENKQNIIKQIVAGVCALHSIKPPIINGHLKPSNVLIDDCGIVKLSEFGISDVNMHNRYL